MTFGSNMSNDIQQGAPPPLRPSVFISYASADRASARALRDALAAAGLDVWLDEEELGGGEAWDAKIRNQIRTCTYFMPVISSTTEVRREGYFRREWRFAVERTLDLADDVMFLVPIVIDNTRDVGARVPEKFFSVQWLRVPGGQATDELRELATKLATGEAVSAHPPVPAAAVPRSARRVTEKPAPPPFPRFPAYPEHGQRLRFAYELVIWFGRILHSLWYHLPRFVRVIAAVVIIFNLISWVFRESSPSAARKADKAAVIDGITKAVEDKAPAAGESAAGEVIESIVDAAANVAQAGRPLAVVDFSGAGKEAKTYANQAFKRTCELLLAEDKGGVSVSPFPLKEGATDADALRRGRRLKSQFVLTAQVRADPPSQPMKLAVKLYDMKQSVVIWEESYDTTQLDPAGAAERIVAEVRKRVAVDPAPKPAG